SFHVVGRILPTQPVVRVSMVLFSYSLLSIVRRLTNSVTPPCSPPSRIHVETSLCHVDGRTGVAQEERTHDASLVQTTHGASLISRSLSRASWLTVEHPRGLICFRRNCRTGGRL